MTKLKLLLIAFLTLIASDEIVFGKTDYSLYENLNTINFKEKFNTEEIANMKMLCSYDFCTYARGDNGEEVIEDFTNFYLKKLNDRDKRAYYLVKGIKITKIIYYK